MTTYLAIKAVLPWVMSIGTILTLYLAGEKKCIAWLIGLLNQVLWFVYIYMTGSYGLSPMAGVITVIYARNLWRWKPAFQEKWVKINGDYFR